MTKIRFLVPAAVLIALSSPVAAQSETQDIASLIANVSSVSEQLSTTISSFGTRIVDSANSSEEGTRLLDEMIAAAQSVHGSLDEDSPIWTDLNKLLEEWKVKRDDLMSAAAKNSALKPIADTWQERIDKALVLRDQIRTQSTDGMVLIEELEKQREVVLALYDAQLADQVLATMEQISSELTEMNSAVGAIVDQAKAVGGDSVATE